MKEGWKPECPEKTPDDELQKKKRATDALRVTKYSYFVLEQVAHITQAASLSNGTLLVIAGNEISDQLAKGWKKE